MTIPDSIRASRESISINAIASIGTLLSRFLSDNDVPILSCTCQMRHLKHDPTVVSCLSYCAAASFMVVRNHDRNVILKLFQDHTNNSRIRGDASIMIPEARSVTLNETRH